jgi:hypothetical protein
MTRRVSDKAVDQRIDKVYREHCAGMQIDVMRIGGLFNMARKMIRHGCSDDALGECMLAYLKPKDAAPGS